MIFSLDRIVYEHLVGMDVFSFSSITFLLISATRGWFREEQFTQSTFEVRITPTLRPYLLNTRPAREGDIRRREAKRH